MPNLAVKQNFLLQKVLKSVFLKVKKDVWHIVDPLPLECHALFEWPLIKNWLQRILNQKGFQTATETHKVKLVSIKIFVFRKKF